MKNQIIMVAAALFICTALTAQPRQHTHTQGREKSPIETKSRQQSHPRTMDQHQDQDQGIYKNRGQEVSAQRHARNAERKALKDQEKAIKKQEKQTRRLQKEMDKKHMEMLERKNADPGKGRK